MESKAKAWFNRRYTDLTNQGIKFPSVTNKLVENSIEIAEQEMREKAIEAYKSICKRRQQRNDPYHGCEYNCDSCHRIKEFINELNK